MRGEHYVPASGGPMGRGPVAAGEVAIFAGDLEDAVERDGFDDFELSHSLALGSAGVGKRSWIHACHGGVSRAAVSAA